MAITRRILAFPLIQLIIECLAILALLSPFDPLYYPLGLLPTYPSAMHNIFAQALTTILTLLVFALAVRRLEGRSLTKVGLALRPGTALRQFLLGFVTAAFLMSVVIGIMSLAGWYSIKSIEPLGSALAILLVWGTLFLGGAIFEEIFFRGIIYRLVEQQFGSWIAVAASSLLFGFTHLTTPHGTIWGALAIALSAGVAASAIYILTRSLWPLFGAHFAWNFFEGTVWGVQVSGNVGIAAIVHSTTSGPALWTGGEFGPEAGLPVILIGIGLSIILLTQAVRHNRILAPPWLHSSSPPPASTID